jgi:hypothetical protein
MCYDMYYDKKAGQSGGTKPPMESDDKKEEKAFQLLKSLKNQKMDNRQFAQMREEYYRTLGDAN